MQNFMKILQIGCLFCLLSAVEAKITIVTIAFNKPEFIALQHKSLCAFLQDDWEQIIFINSSDKMIAKQLAKACDQQGIKHVRVPVWENKDLSTHGEALNFAFDYLISQGTEKVLILEEDFGDCDLAFFPRRMYHIDGKCSPTTTIVDPDVCYINPIFAYLDLSTLPEPNTLRWEWFWRLENKALDTGGPTYTYLKKHPNLRILYLDHYPDLLEYNDFFFLSDIRYFQLQRAVALSNQWLPISPLLDHCRNKHTLHFFHNFTVFHYSSGSNTILKLPTQFHKDKLQLTKELINSQIKYYENMTRYLSDAKEQ